MPEMFHHEIILSVFAVALFSRQQASFIRNLPNISPPGSNKISILPLVAY
jgi:hypothetical protein